MVDCLRLWLGGEGKATVETCCKCSIKQDAAIPPKSLECPLRVQGMRIQSWNLDISVTFDEVTCTRSLGLR